MELTTDLIKQFIKTIESLPIKLYGEEIPKMEVSGYLRPNRENTMEEAEKHTFFCIPCALELEVHQYKVKCGKYLYEFNSWGDETDIWGDRRLYDSDEVRYNIEQEPHYIDLEIIEV